jgi:hypothetical protein
MVAGGEGLAIGEEVHGGAVAGERDVGGVAVHQGVGEDVDAVHGGALRLMLGDGITVRDGAVAVGIEGHRAAVVEADGEAVRLGGEDGAQGAVADADRGGSAGGFEVHDVASLMVVAQEDDAVAAGELDAAEADSGTELAGGLAPGGDGFAELRHLVAVGEDELCAGGIVAAIVGVRGEELGAAGAHAFPRKLYPSDE